MIFLRSLVSPCDRDHGMCRRDTALSGCLMKFGDIARCPLMTLSPAESCDLHKWSL